MQPFWYFDFGQVSPVYELQNSKKMNLGCFKSVHLW
jgi:hypothetical protein